MDRAIIGGTPSDWIVREVRIGNVVVFSGAIPGEALSAQLPSGAFPDPFTGHLVAAGIDVTVVVDYRGTSGANFVCGVLVTATP